MGRREMVVREKRKRERERLRQEKAQMPSVLGNGL